MDKVKIALTILSVAIVVGPLIGIAFVYRDNLLGLVVPPQIKSLINGGDSNGLTSVGSQFQMPTLVGDPQYNAQTGAVAVLSTLRSHCQIQFQSIICLQMFNQEMVVLP